MRTYYIFEVNKNISYLTKSSPYMLFKSFEEIYKGKKEDLYMASTLFEQIASRVSQKINEQIKNSFKDNDFYMNFGSKHTYYNKYKDEKSELIVKNSYLICNTNHIRPALLSKLSGDYFVCDFQNKDYFWLNEICC